MIMSVRTDTYKFCWALPRLFSTSALFHISILYSLNKYQPKDERANGHRMVWEKKIMFLVQKIELIVITPPKVTLLELWRRQNRSVLPKCLTNSGPVVATPKLALSIAFLSFIFFKIELCECFKNKCLDQPKFIPLTDLPYLFGN